MTRPTEAADGGGVPRPAPAAPPPPQPRVERRRRLPGGRAVAGGLLVALAAVGTLAAWQQASGTPDRSYAVAAHPLEPGEVLASDDVRVVPADLPSGVAGGAFRSADDVAGRVALGPVAEGELLQAGALSEAGAGPPTAEVSFALPRDRALDGRLGSGDLVDVFVTYDDRGTSLVAERVQVVAVTDGGATFAAGAELTVTLALAADAPRGDLIQAVRAGEVTLVRSTLLGSAAPAAGGPSSSSTGAGGDPAGGPDTSGSGTGAGVGTSGSAGSGGAGGAGPSGADANGSGTGGAGSGGGVEPAGATDPSGSGPPARPGGEAAGGAGGG